MKRQLKFPILKYSLLLVAAMAVFLASAFLAHKGGMSSVEIAVFRRLYNIPEVLVAFIYAVTFFGSSWMFITAVAISVALKQRALATRIFLSGGLTYIFFQSAKLLVARPRPYELLYNVQVRDPFALGYGFPSGHTAMATAVSLLLLRYLPRHWRFIVPIWIIAVGVSRVSLGVHAPLDIVGGFAIGVSVFCLQQIIVQYLSQRSVKL